MNTKNQQQKFYVSEEEKFYNNFGNKCRQKDIIIFKILKSLL